MNVKKRFKIHKKSALHVTCFFPITLFGLDSRLLCFFFFARPSRRRWLLCCQIPKEIKEIFNIGAGRAYFPLCDMCKSILDV